MSTKQTSQQTLNGTPMWIVDKCIDLAIELGQKYSKTNMGSKQVDKLVDRQVDALKARLLKK